MARRDFGTVSLTPSTRAVGDLARGAFASVGSHEVIGAGSTECMYKS
jgi:hypothetical protein